MVRSPGFGSISCYSIALFRLAFALAPDINSLTLQHKITRRLILQQARYHTINSALSISLSFSLFFSPFHHCTRSLSVTSEYLALRDGPRRFRQGFTCPALLGILKRDYLLSITRLSLSMAQLSSCIHLTNNFVTLRVFCNILWKSHDPLCTTIAVYHVHKV